MVVCCGVKNRQRPRIQINLENGDEICIQGNSLGFEWLARRCLSLVRSPSQGHIHLNHEGDVLENGSCACTLSLIDNYKTNQRKRCKGLRHFILWATIFIVALLLLYCIMLIQ